MIPGHPSRRQCGGGSFSLVEEYCIAVRGALLRSNWPRERWRMSLGRRGWTWLRIASAGDAPRPLWKAPVAIWRQGSTAAPSPARLPLLATCCAAAVLPSPFSSPPDAPSSPPLGGSRYASGVRCRSRRVAGCRVKSCICPSQGARGLPKERGSLQGLGRFTACVST